MVNQNHCITSFKGKVKQLLKQREQQIIRSRENTKSLQKYARDMHAHYTGPLCISLHALLHQAIPWVISTSTVGFNQSPQTGIRMEIIRAVCHYKQQAQHCLQQRSERYRGLIRLSSIYRVDLIASALFNIHCYKLQSELFIKQ